MKKRYYVYTWDAEKRDWTPQKGVRCGPWSLWGLRKPLRLLRGMGYSADKDDPSVLLLDCHWKEDAIHVHEAPRKRSPCPGEEATPSGQ